MGDTVRLVSCDGEEFMVEHGVAELSQTLRSFLGRPGMFAESLSQQIELPVRAVYLRRVVEFMEFKRHADITKDTREFKVEDDETLELLDIAAYLRI